jgi:multisubunit Na+/H+ antiporter MnhF subunit
MIAWLAIAGFVAAGCLAGVRILVGPALADRVAALDVALINLMGAIVVRATATGDTSYTVVLVVISIVGFTATTAASRFIEAQGGRP